MRIWTILVAGGSGRRFGRMKQFDRLGDQRIIDWSIESVRGASEGVVVVLPESMVADSNLDVDLVVAGGSSRSDSVRSGLAALPAGVTHVLVHDGARPLASRELVDEVVAALASGAKGVVPVVPVTDSLRRIGGAGVDRSGLVAVQTPQGFELETLNLAYASGLEASDDASLLDLLGVPVTQTSGDPKNIKVTVPNDLSIAEVLLDAN